MSHTASNNPFRLPVSTTTCHQDHQHWQQIICQQEEEISQLHALLLDVLNQYNCRSLRHDAVDYCRDLNHLRTKFDRLHRDLICESVDCSLAKENLSCTDSRFDLSATIERHAIALAGEFSRIKAGCLQFLSSMMSLNLM